MACLNQKVSQKFESVLMDVGVEDTMKTLDMKCLACKSILFGIYIPEHKHVFMFL